MKFLKKINGWLNVCISWYLKLNDKKQPIVSAIILFVLLVLSFAAFADEYSTIRPVKIINIDRTITKYVASAASSAQCGFDNGSYAFQVCGAVGFSSHDKAFTLGAGQKYKNFMLNTSVTFQKQNGDQEKEWLKDPAIGVSGIWKIK